MRISTEDNGTCTGSAHGHCRPWLRKDQWKNLARYFNFEVSLWTHWWCTYLPIGKPGRKPACNGRYAPMTSYKKNEIRVWFFSSAFLARILEVCVWNTQSLRQSSRFRKYRPHTTIYIDECISIFEYSVKVVFYQGIFCVSHFINWRS